MKNLCASLYHELNTIINELPSLIFVNKPELLDKLQKLSDYLVELSCLDSQIVGIKLIDIVSEAYSSFYKSIPLSLISSNENIHRSNRIIRGDIAHHQRLFDSNHYTHCEA